MPNHVTGIDVGTYHVKVVVAEHPDSPRETPRILGTGYAESRGIKRGYVISPTEAARSIAAAVAQASKSARLKIKSAYLAVGGVGLDEAFSRGEVVVERGDSLISSQDIPRSIRAAEQSLPTGTLENRRIIHTIPLRYFVDGALVLGHTPVGMKGMRLAVEVLFITALERHVADLVEATEAAGVEVEDIVASPIAASLVALTKMQKRVGCVLLNIGSETLTAVVFEDSIPLSVKVFPIGAVNITNDLALALRISPEEALGLQHGAVLGAPYSKRKVEDVVTRRLSDMFKLVETHLKKIEKDALLPAGVILTGGGASMVAAESTAKAVLRLPSRTAVLVESPSARMQLRDSSWAVAYGLTVWGFTQGGDLEHQESMGIIEFLGGIWRWLRRFLP